MKITPIEIRQKEFEKAFRGYEKEEVDAFLVSLSQEWERIIDENKELRRRLEAAEKEVGKLREVENSLYRALKTAEDTGSNMIEQANKTAELHLREAQMKAEAILNDAKSKAKATLEDAEMKAKEISDDLQDEIKMLEREYYYIENQRENLLSEMKSLVNDVLEKVTRNQGKGGREDISKKIKEYRASNVERRVSSSFSSSMAREEEKTEPKTEVEEGKATKDKGGNEQDNSFFDNI